MIIVVGSINMDIVVQVDHQPAPGETILGSDYETHPGGKGANQAVAAARLGANVRMIGRVGSDAFGQQLLSGLNHEGIDTHWLKTLETPSGVAFINVDKQGQNSIIVAPGANARLKPEELRPEAFAKAKVVLMQLEIPLNTVRRAAKLGQEAGATVILNAAPAKQLEPSDYQDIDVLVVNEIEAGMLLGKARACNPAEALALADNLLKLIPAVIITLGEQGAVWKSDNDAGQLPAFAVAALDTTAAGDAFLGALALALSQGDSLANAVRSASAAGALAASKAGAQPSLPTRDELENFLRGSL